MFHLQGEQYVMYNKHQPLLTVVSCDSTHMTNFITWFEANKKYTIKRNLKYLDIPTRFVWNKGTREWTPRKRGFGIGRMHYVPSSTGGGVILYEDIVKPCKGPDVL